MNLFVLITLPVTLYFAFLESSPWQATLGKRWKELKVITKDNIQLRVPRVIGRTLLKFIPGSWHILVSGKLDLLHRNRHFLSWPDLLLYGYLSDPML